MQAIQYYNGLYRDSLNLAVLAQQQLKANIAIANQLAAIHIMLCYYIHNEQQVDEWSWCAYPDCFTDMGCAIWGTPPT